MHKWDYKKYEDTKSFERSITLKELQEIELNILKTFHDFCEKNNLTYFLAGGTLLGAIRHSGFIPWDDDIDVLMPRPDYEKFLSLCPEKLGIYETRSIHTRPEIHTRPFIRLHDNRYMVMLQEPPFYMPPWLDIFPMDGIPSGDKETTKHFNKARIIKGLVFRSWVPLRYQFKKKKKWFSKVISVILYFPLRIIGYNKILNYLEKYGKKYKFEDCEYVGCVVAGGHGKREKMKKSSFCKPIKVKFEDTELFAPAGFDYYLTSLYRDYRSIPSNVVPHFVCAWKK